MFEAFEKLVSLVNEMLAAAGGGRRVFHAGAELELLLELEAEIGRNGCDGLVAADKLLVSFVERGIIPLAGEVGANGVRGDLSGVIVRGKRLGKLVESDLVGRGRGVGGCFAAGFPKAKPFPREKSNQREREKGECERNPWKRRQRGIGGAGGVKMELVGGGLHEKKISGEFGGRVVS